MDLRRITSSRSWVSGLPALAARRPKEAFVHARRNPERKSHPCRKHVFSVYGGAYPVPMLCSLIWSQGKKKIKRAASSPRYIGGWKIRTAVGALCWLGTGPVKASSPVCCQHPASPDLCIPTWRAKIPPGEAVGGEERGRGPPGSWGLVSSAGPVRVFVCDALGCSHPLPGPADRHGPPGPAQEPFWDHPLPLWSDVAGRVSFPITVAKGPWVTERWVLTGHRFPGSWGWSSRMLGTLRVSSGV